MSSVLETILVWAEAQLPEDRRIWISDLRSEAKHVPDRFARQRFLWSGTLAAIGQVLRIRLGVRRVGQMLLGAALLLLCLGGLIITKDMPDDIVRTTFYGALILYGAAGGLAVIDLRLMKLYTFACGFFLVAINIILGLDILPSLGANSEFLQAFALEAAFMMGGLFVAAAYLSWAEDPGHA